MSGSSPKLKLVKPSVAAGPAPAAEMSRESLIDEFGELKRKEAAFQPTEARLKILRPLIMGWIPDTHPGDQPISFPGHLYVVNCTPAQRERSVSQPAKLLKLLGAVKFWSICKVAIGALEEMLGEDEAEKWLGEARTGPRKVSAVAKASPAAPEAA